MDNVTTIGIDLGDKYHHYCVLDAVGQITEQGRLCATREGLTHFFTTLPAARVALEAGTHSPWVSRLLIGMGHEVLVANPRKLRLIWANDRKCDERDAQMLARLARFDPELLYPIEHRSATAQADLSMLKARDALVAVRTKLINHVRDVVKSFGERLPSCSSEAFVHKAGAELPKSLCAALGPLVQTIGELTAKIRAFDKKIERRCERDYPQTERLRQIKGVGPITSLAFVLTLERAGRFARSREVGAFLGLVPRRDQSGDSDRQLRITKAGDVFMRKLLVSAAHYILGAFGPDTALRRWGLKLAERGGKNAKKRAVVAVARKLSGVLHHLWSSGEDYDPFPAPPGRRRVRKSRGPTNVDMASCGQHGARRGRGALERAVLTTRLG